MTVGNITRKDGVRPTPTP